MGRSFRKGDIVRVTDQCSVPDFIGLVGTVTGRGELTKYGWLVTIKTAKGTMYTLRPSSLNLVQSMLETVRG